ncbi:hypothetical protein DUNSADRAFT_13052 [Dunaliella salina]|uniref:Uncharacterized protein n=1 Tax=Dunaliella salina TaxID=3046 RepID=A0ABQ7GA61_DUNSA|nr:hypothetical protein DUNSADRAFT_13052 [Dunaliella salina]|eukprot:KAF5831494.1 hypothetical protein DUNSADRAFT_13052 [Dunaliella salina]
MSKKNSLAQKRKRHEYDLKCEKEAAEKKQKASLKKAEKKIDKPQKKKTIKIRRGMKLRGIKVKDADSKKKVQKLLAQERAMKMAIDEDPQVSGKKSRGISVKAATKRVAKKDKAAKKSDSGAEGMVIG